METKIVNSGKNVCVMVVDKLRAIAIANMDFMGDHWWLARLKVDKLYRKNGLGRQLVNHLKDNSKGYSILVAPSGYFELTKEEQFSFYERCGFVKQTEDTLLLEGEIKMRNEKSFKITIEVSYRAGTIPEDMRKQLEKNINRATEQSDLLDDCESNAYVTALSVDVVEL